MKRENEKNLNRQTREEILKKVPHWQDLIKGASFDQKKAKALAQVSSQFSVDIYLGTWCPDCERELTRFWAALDHAQAVAFDLKYFDLTREEKKQLTVISRIPTFIVKFRGVEIGRIVEEAPLGIEGELVEIFQGWPATS